MDQGAAIKSSEQNTKSCLWSAHILEGGAGHEQGIKHINNNLSDKKIKQS